MIENKKQAGKRSALKRRALKGLRYLRTLPKYAGSAAALEEFLNWPETTAAAFSDDARANMRGSQNMRRASDILEAANTEEEEV